MTYEPKTWNSGDTIAADDLNHIEEGIAQSSGGTSEVLVVSLTSTEDGDCVVDTLNKTWQEIFDAPFAVLKLAYGENNVRFVAVDGAQYDAEQGYEVSFTDGERFSAQTADGYPLRKTCGGAD